MDLKIKDVAELLNVSETTIRRWLNEGKIPAYRLNHQYRFSRIEIENWMMSCRLKKDKEDLFSAKKEPSCCANESKRQKRQLEEHGKKGIYQYGLYRAIHSGHVLTSIEAQTKEGVIRQTMEAISDDLSVDPYVLTDLLCDREKLMSTSLNNGIAVPHTRDFLLKGPKDVVVVVFPKEPVDWGALDGHPVHTLFFLFASDDKHHLHLLAKLAHLSSNEEALELLASRPNKQDFLDYLRKWESPKVDNLALR